MQDGRQGPWFDFVTDECPVADTLKALSGKHKAAILHCLNIGDLYFLELSRALPSVSRKVLTQQLKELESSDLICRREIGDARRRVQYSLSKRGRGLSDILKQMYEWAIENRD